MTTPESNDKDGPVHPPVIDIEAEDVTPSPDVKSEKTTAYDGACRSCAAATAAQAQIAWLAQSRPAYPRYCRTRGGRLALQGLRPALLAERS